ncbi:MAG TPA: polysaccharide deacetylase family protein [Ferruginibacter sp.]|nr:polysaccharide deacetylase family protein [Ferruginibacter sp.]HMP21103.1 polysaccharide deacetylase family protein [Ferruginibacter sp.]
MKIISIAFFLLSANFIGYAQLNDSPWKHKKCAVVLTYDDAIPQQLYHAIPVLDSLQLKATFYLTAFAVKNRINDWRLVAEKGHELGNHTLFHPCIGGIGREWLNPDYNLNAYTASRLMDEIRMTNVFLEALDGKTKRTFAYTCGDTKVKDSSFVQLLKNDFVAARAVRNQLVHIDEADLYNIACYVVNGETAAQMEEWVRQAMEKKALLVILFHGVGGGNGLDVSISEHSKFLHFLKKRQDEIWIAPMIDVAEYINSILYQKK